MQIWPGILYWNLFGGKSHRKALPHRVGIRAGDLFPSSHDAVGDGTEEIKGRSPQLQTLLEEEGEGGCCGRSWHAVRHAPSLLTALCTGSLLTAMVGRSVAGHCWRRLKPWPSSVMDSAGRHSSVWPVTELTGEVWVCCPR